MAQEIRRPGSGKSPAAGTSRCARCGAPFHCGMEDPGGCWCAKLPPLPRDAYSVDAGCLCEACLRKAFGAPLGQHSG